MASKISQRSEIASVVNSALKNLNELGQSLKAYQFGNDTAELLCVDGIVETIKELEAERIRLHELLETETIKASGLRYKLHYFPGDISSEIQAAVTSARQSNEVEIKRLKFQLEGIDKNISDLEKQYRNLQEENSTLEPDRDDMQMGHDEIIALLNQKMADKASKQITLNETRDKLRETYKRIIDLEESMVQLKEDLRRERVEARMEKDDLHQSVENTKLKVTEQRKLNDLKREEIDKLQVELVDSESVLESKKKVIRKCETSRARFESQEMQLNKDLQKEIRSNAALTQEGMKIVKSNEAISNKLNNEKLKIEELLKQYEKSIGAAEKENAKLSREKLILEKELKVAEVAEKSDKELVGDAERKLARAKMELAEQNQECGRLQGENLEMEQDIEALALSHQAEVDVLNKKIEESKTELVTEKQERLLLQNSKDTVTKEANQFKAEYGKEMATMSRMISSGKAEHSKCTEYGNELKKTLKLDEQEIITKQNQIKNLKQEYTRLQKQLKSELQAVQENITKLGKEQESKKDNIEDKTPIFKDLEQQFKKRSEDFEAVKKNVAVMKNKKANLEIAVERAERDVEKMAAPQTRLKEELKCKRAEALKQLAHQAEEVQGVEKEIISTGQKLGTILNENSKFKQAKNLLEMEIAGLQKLLLGNSLTRESLAEELFKYRGILRESWREDVILDKTYAENDVQVLANIDQLQQKTDEREKRIDTIHEQLEEQLDVLSHFIDGVANLRPKDSAPPR